MPAHQVVERCFGAFVGAEVLVAIHRMPAAMLADDGEGSIACFANVGDAHVAP